MKVTRVGAIVLTVIFTGILGPGSASAQGLDRPRVTVGVQVSNRPDVPDMLIGTVTTLEGNPVGTVPVKFWVRTDVFNGRWTFVGEGLTDATGVARYPFVPRRQIYTARVTFEGDEQFDATEGVSQVRFPERSVFVLVPTDLTQLGSLRVFMPRIIGIVVGLIWASLIGLFVHTLLSIRRLAGVEDRAAGDG